MHFNLSSLLLLGFFLLIGGPQNYCETIKSWLKHSKEAVVWEFYIPTPDYYSKIYVVC